MKKTLFSFLTIIMLVQFIPFYQTYVCSEIELILHKNTGTVEIQELGDLSNPNDFDKAVNKYTNEHSASIFCVSYPYDENTSDPITDIYVCSKKNPELLKKYITQKQFKSIHNSSKILSNKNGDFNIFSRKNDYHIQSFKNLSGKSLAREYFIYPQSESITFQKYFQQNYGITFSANGMENEKQIYDYENVLAIDIVLAITLFILIGFWVVGQYQLNATKGLLGYSNARCIRKILCDFLLMLVGSTILSSVIMAIYLIFYNRLHQLTLLYAEMLKHFGLCYVVILFIAIVSIILFYSTDVKYALKGRKPFVQLSICSVALKIIMIVFVCLSITSTKTAVEQNKQFETQEQKWGQIHDYRFVEMYSPVSNNDYDRKVNLKCKEFMAKTKGILIDDTEVETAREYPEDTKEEPYYYNKVSINNEYLKINPILDTNGNKVSIDEKSMKSDETIILVPEKYQKDEKEVYKELFDWYNFSRYADEGPEVYKKHESGEIPPVTVNIQYVKNNQKYFAYSFDMSQYKYNFIKDPIAVIVTDDNMGADMCRQFLTFYSYIVEISDKQTIEEVNKVANEIGIDKELTNLPTTYSCVDTQVKKSHENYIKAMLTLALSIIGILAVTIYLTKSYIDESKKTLFVKKMLGYSPIKIFGLYLALIFSLDTLVFIITSFALKVNFFIPALIMIAIDILISVIFISIYQLKLNKSVLKGN